MSSELLATKKTTEVGRLPSKKVSASVAVLMCTRNGEKFLVEQLESIERQSHRNFHVFISDDGSTDSTLAILQQQQRSWGGDRISLFNGPGKGFATNFLSLSCNPEVDADFFAWCDQDDIWHEDKLKKATEWLSGVPADIPALYCSRTELVSEVGQPIGFSTLFPRKPDFCNALVQNIAGGNTMVFNRELMMLLREAGDSVPAVSHDWWAYLLVSGCGGKIFYDSNPSILYRQHDSNCVGANTGVRESGKRVKQLLHGRYRQWMDQNIVALQAISHRFTPENRNTLELFSRARKGNLFKRLAGMRRAGVYRQTYLGNIGLLAAILIRRV